MVAFLQLSKLETLSLPAGLNYAPVNYTVVFLLPSRLKQVTPQNELTTKLQPVPKMGFLKLAIVSPLLVGCLK